MSSVKKIIFVLIVLNCFSYSTAFATKCLKAQTMAELKKDFPIIIRGKISNRQKIEGDENSFTIKIHVQKVLHGKLKTKDLKATEIHYGKGFWKVYEVGKEYTFPIDTKGKVGSYEVVLPVDGCPELPAE